MVCRQRQGDAPPLDARRRSQLLSNHSSGMPCPVSSTPASRGHVPPPSTHLHRAQGTDPYHLSIPAVAAHLCRRAALPSTAPASRLLPALLIRRDVPGADLVREIGLACSWTEEDALAAARATVKGVVGRGLAEARERAARAAAAFVGAWEDEFPASWALLTWRLCQEDLAAALVGA